jgi:hypothetical protein
MNGPDGTSGGAEPGLEDPALLAEIEAEFAELAQEIARINAMPREAVPVKAKLLEELKRQWRERFSKRGDKPEWRERLDQTLTVAIEALLEHGLQENPDGSLGFALRGDVVQEHGGKVMRGLIEGFQNLLAERFPVVPPVASTASSTPGAPSGAVSNILQTLMGAFASAVQKVKLPEPEVATTVSPGAGTASGTVEVAGNLASGSEADPTRGLRERVGDAGAVVQPMSASVSFSSKGAGEGGAGGPEAASPAPDPTAARPTNNAGQALVQQLMQAFGQALRPMLAQSLATAVTPAPPPPPPATVPPVAEAVPPPTVPPPTVPPVAEAAPAPNLTQLAGGLAGLGQWLQATLQRGAGNLTVPSAPPQAPPAEGAPSAPPTAAPPTDAPPAAPAAPPKAASLNIDFAGLLQTIFKGAKVSVGQASVSPPVAPPAPAAPEAVPAPPPGPTEPGEPSS